MHPTTAGDNSIHIESRRFQIPLGALVPARLRNRLPVADDTERADILPQRRARRGLPLNGQG